MPIRVVVHIHNEDPFVAEIEDIPEPRDNFLVLRNPRKRDGKALTFVTNGATSFIYPWSRISFVEVMDEAKSQDSVVGFFREEGRSGHL
jgi:hypothetical protein